MTAAAVTLASAIADTLSGSSFFSAVYPLPNPQPESQSASVVPAGGELSTATKSALSFVVTVVVSPLDYSAALGWLYQAAEEVSKALAADPTCGGACSGVRVAKWERAYLTSIIGGSDALALDVTLTPTYAKGI